MKVSDAWRTWTDAEPQLRDRLPGEVVNRLALAYQAGYYAETVRWVVPLTARVPQFVSLFAQWQQYYSRLADEQERTSHA